MSLTTLSLGNCWTLGTAFAALEMPRRAFAIMKLLPILSLTLASSLASNAAVLVNSSSFSYSQDFDGLGDQDATSYTFVDDSTISGWYANSEEMDTNSDEYFGSDGSENGGEVYSYGDDADRALGYLGSGGNDYTNFGVLFRNTSGATINIVSISYVGEQWRSGGDTSDNNNNFVVSHQVFAADGGSMPASTDLTGWTVTNALEFTAPQPTATTGALDGNAAANQTTFSGIQLSGLNWQDGEDLWIRFTGNNGGGTDAGLAIDDFSMTVVPEPAIAVLGGLGLLGLLRRRR